MDRYKDDGKEKCDSCSSDCNNKVKAIAQMPNAYLSDITGKKYPLLIDVIGQEKAKARIWEAIQGFQNNDLLKFYGTKTIKGMMLYGPPGVGKSMLVKALTNEIDATFHPLDIGAVGDIYVNSTPKNIMASYNLMRAKLDNEQNALQRTRFGVFYIDECESVLKRRMNVENSAEDDKVVNTLCEIMDGPYADERILFVGTTNKFSAIDDAFLRTGRFDIQLELTMPSLHERERMFERYKITLRKANGRLNFYALDFPRLAEISEGFAGSDIAYVMDESVRQQVFTMIRRGETRKDVKVTHDQLEAIVLAHSEERAGLGKKNAIGFSAN